MYSKLWLYFHKFSWNFSRAQSLTCQVCLTWDNHLQVDHSSLMAIAQPHSVHGLWAGRLFRGISPFLKVYFIDYCITVVPFSPFIPLCPAHSLPLTFPLTLGSCPWVVHISSLVSPFPILFLTSPCLFCTYHLSFLFPVTFRPFSPLPADNPPCDLHFYDSAPVLVVCLVVFVFVFSGSVVDNCEFAVILLFIVLIFFFFLDKFL